jgi:hypothetical protein
VGSFDHGGHDTVAVGSRTAAAGGFDHGGHGLHHGGTTSMAAGPDLGPTRLDPGAAVFLFLKIGLSYWLEQLILKSSYF